MSLSWKDLEYKLFNIQNPSQKPAMRLGVIEHLTSILESGFKLQHCKKKKKKIEKRK
jgi:hypothetical protein